MYRKDPELFHPPALISNLGNMSQSLVALVVLSSQGALNAFPPPFSLKSVLSSETYISDGPHKEESTQK